MKTSIDRRAALVSAALVFAAVAAMVLWVQLPASRPAPLRVPGTDRPPGEPIEAAAANPVLRGTVQPGPGQPADIPGWWPQFRGPQRDGFPEQPGNLLREWGSQGPRQLWSVALGEGYAGPVVANGRVYLLDYDREKQQDALRCLSLADGREIWRFAYPIQVKRNHGMSRTVPAIASNAVVALGPKCHVACVDATSGERKWGLDLVRDYGATVPPWYAGQCPLIDQRRVILAPGGPDALLLALDLETGREIWKTPNPHDWKMTHVSVMPMEFSGHRMYVYCASAGVVGVSATDGAVLWETTDWKISIAAVASPVPLPDGRVFLSGGYNAGSMLLQLEPVGDRLNPKVRFRLKPSVFGATQQTPVYKDGCLIGIRPDEGDLACLDLDGNVRWSTGPDAVFGLGPFLVAGDLIYAVDDSGRLSLFQTTPAGAQLLAQAQVIDGREAWAPLALVNGRLLLRDLTRMLCLEVGSPSSLTTAPTATPRKAGSALVVTAPSDTVFP